VGDQTAPPSTLAPPEPLEPPELEPLLAPEPDPIPLELDPIPLELEPLPPELEPLDPPDGPEPLELPELVTPELEPLPAAEPSKLGEASDAASVALVPPEKPGSGAPPPLEQPNGAVKHAR
jgi:hypothetical protein